MTRRADILVVAIGRPKFVTADMVRDGAVVIDVGVNRDPETGKLCGDVDFAAIEPKASVITPVPGGVGPMTICCLMENKMCIRDRRTSRAIHQDGIAIDSPCIGIKFHQFRCSSNAGNKNIEIGCIRFRLGTRNDIECRHTYELYKMCIRDSCGASYCSMRY